MGLSSKASCSWERSFVSTKRVPRTHVTPSSVQVCEGLVVGEVEGDFVDGAAEGDDEGASVAGVGDVVGAFVFGLLVGNGVGEFDGDHVDFDFQYVLLAP